MQLPHNAVERDHHVLTAADPVHFLSAISENDERPAFRAVRPERAQCQTTGTVSTRTSARLIDRRTHDLYRQINRDPRLPVPQHMESNENKLARIRYGWMVFALQKQQ
jgi:hypothetical protein